MYIYTYHTRHKTYKKQIVKAFLYRSEHHCH